MGWQIFGKKKKVEPKYYKISEEKVTNIIDKSFGRIVNKFIIDGEYIALTELEMKNMLYKDKTNLNKYIKDFYDCDDFAFDLMKVFQKYAFGVAFIMNKDGGRHAVNVQIDPINGIARLIEPQTDGWFTDYKFVYFILI